ncbi:MAG: type II toxin-antitoxin system PrlF family antitoxin [Candidatus Thermoplasmatota archaeon]|nr:type II toxin-antitoxin system PrlF family antitoxin [Candidatus Thermoplasmatota archaeon]MBU4190138.1 type II toxin-antitoxin system PrlF family antitoxin [Candidatus Thermoplasmatota archaeon]MCG2825947.1 type II toxin-antitoxin system PrlF family antitoxin [Thermoplasmatales archaeon]
MKINMDDIRYITETALTIRGSRRRTTVPKVIVDDLKLKNGDKIRWILFRDNTVNVAKVKNEKQKRKQRR